MEVDGATDFVSLDTTRVCAKGLTSPGASRIRGRPLFRFMISGSDTLGVNCRLEDPVKVAVSSMEILGFLGLPGTELLELDDKADDDEGIAFVTLVLDDDVVPEELLPLLEVTATLLLSSEELPVETSAKPLILRFSAVLRREAN